VKRSGGAESLALEHGGKRRRKSVGWLETERLDVCVREVGIAHPGGEPCIWTNRMLTTLETGVKGGKWFSLVDKVWREDSLGAAFERVATNKGSAGVDHVSVMAYAERRDMEIAKLAEELQAGTYRPLPLKRVYIEKPGSTEKRPLGIPTVRDRTVHGAVKQVVEPIFEAGFAANSYGFRPGLGCKDALREVQRLLEDGWTQVVDVDNETMQRAQSRRDHPPHQRETARLVRVLQTCLPGIAGKRRWVGSHAPAQHSAQEKQAEGTRTRLRQSTLAKRILHKARAVLLQRGTCRSCQSVKTVRPSTGEPYAGKPPVRFGGRGGVQSAFPTPITHACQCHTAKSASQ